MATQTISSEQIIFVSPDGTPIQLLVNPETLTLTWKKVINRIRTKTRLVTLFWGEEPVKFTYRGQTGYSYPNVDEQNSVLDQVNSGVTDVINAYDALINLYQTELTLGGPYSFGTAAANRQQIALIQNQLTSLGATLLPRTSLLQSLNTRFTNTEILYLSKKFRILKDLENLYRRHQNPSDALVQVIYRDYIFKGYFESFNYTDDARNPWNWIYTIDFTILDWKENPASQITSTGEILLLPSSTAMQQNIDVTTPQGTIDFTTNQKFKID